MNKLDIKFTYCHGISKLKYCFDFTNHKDNLLYAQNGSMKTSFFNTMYEYKNQLPTQDVFFPQRKTIVEIKDEKGKNIPPENIVCIGNTDFDLPYDNVSSLLVNDKLKKRYDAISTLLDKQKELINKSLKSASGEVIDTLLMDLKIDSINLISDDMFKKEETIEQFEGLKYKKFFNDEYMSNLQEQTVVKTINDYISFCNKIIEEHPIFIKDVFELHNLKNISKSLNDNNYFSPGHLIKLYNKKTKEYTEYNKDILNSLIKEIDSKLTADDNINKTNKILTSKIKSRELNTFLSQNQWIIPYLNNIELLKKKYWNYILSFNPNLIQQINDYKNLIVSNKKELDAILKESNSKENYSKWDEAIKIFNCKFINMPFELTITNPIDVILNKDICSLKYIFHDNSDSNDNISIDMLKKNLSNGERKAFNILNLIFEIQYRILNQIESYIIIDDIADSFDYKNKYAIVELLYELNKNDVFHLIIMTHNFDFYRTCANRLSVNTLSIIKDSNINIIPFYYKNNIFKYFKEHINEDIFFISSIPFVRNIIELTKGDNDIDYMLLTNTLHYKQNTSNLSISDINDIYVRIINKSSNVKNTNYLNFLFSCADAITKKTSEICLETKLCLSIAIRIKFEMFLFSKIGSWDIVNGFDNNQTHKMIEYCIEKNLLNDDEKVYAGKVAIMVYFRLKC